MVSILRRSQICAPVAAVAINACTPSRGTTFLTGLTPAAMTAVALEVVSIDCGLWMSGLWMCSLWRCGLWMCYGRSFLRHVREGQVGGYRLPARLWGLAPTCILGIFLRVLHISTGWNCVCFPLFEGHPYRFRLLTRLYLIAMILHSTFRTRWHMHGATTDLLLRSWLTPNVRCLLLTHGQGYLLGPRLKINFKHLLGLASLELCGRGRFTALV
mmetsp:Transcript_134521/g.245517  ORF Transcript_134521/g.245517 Transcript_134521/m.245517 type:complete len:214 (-) Transcript_134521:523-1164(-)